MAGRNMQQYRERKISIRLGMKKYRKKNKRRKIHPPVEEKEQKSLASRTTSGLETNRIHTSRLGQSLSKIVQRQTWCDNLEKENRYDTYLSYKGE